MLVLTRRVGEAIIIGDDIKIAVVRIKGNKVRFGIEAPKDLPVYREEVYKRMNPTKNKTFKKEE